MPKIGLFDLDGTLADYDGRMRSDLAKLRGPNEPNPIDTNFNLFEGQSHIEARMDMIKRQPGWWSGLDKFKLGWDILQVANEIGFCNSILTKGPRSKAVAWGEKVEWVNQHLGEEFPIDIMGEDKNNRYGLFLCDDYIPYATGWLKHRPRGVVIMPAGPHNVDGESHHEDIIRYDGTNLAHISDVLQAVYDRETGQNWREVHDRMPIRSR